MVFLSYVVFLSTNLIYIRKEEERRGEKTHRSFSAKVSQLKILAFLSYWYRKKARRCTFKRYSVLDRWIILGWLSRRWDVGIWTGLGWPRIETGGGRL